MGRVAEPDPDRGHVHGALVDEFPLVKAGGDGAELFQLGKAALDGVAVLVAPGVEGGWAAATPAAGAAVLFLVFFDRDDRLDAAAAQVGAVGCGGVGLVAQCPARPAARRAGVPPGDPHLVHQRDELRAVAMLAWGENLGDRAAPPVRDQVNLGGQPAARAAQGLPAPPARRVLVSRSCPPWPVPRAAPGARPRRAGARAPRWNPRSPSSPCPRPHRNRPAARPGSAPRSRPATSGDAAHRRCSSSRTRPAGPATGTRSGSGTRCPRSPSGGHSSDAPAADAPATTAPACPTPHRTRHDDSADHPPGTIYTSQVPRSMRHALAGMAWPRVPGGRPVQEMNPPRGASPNADVSASAGQWAGSAWSCRSMAAPGPHPARQGLHATRDPAEPWPGGIRSCLTGGPFSRFALVWG